MKKLLITLLLGAGITFAGIGGTHNSIQNTPTHVKQNTLGAKPELKFLIEDWNHIGRWYTNIDGSLWQSTKGEWICWTIKEPKVKNILTISEYADPTYDILTLTDSSGTKWSFDVNNPEKGIWLLGEPTTTDYYHYIVNNPYKDGIGNVWWTKSDGTLMEYQVGTNSPLNLTSEYKIHGVEFISGQSVCIVKHDYYELYFYNAEKREISTMRIGDDKKQIMTFDINPTPSTHKTPKNHNGLSTAYVIEIVGGSVIGLIIVTIGIYYFFGEDIKEKKLQIFNTPKKGSK